uniref:primase C-terminal domain-containing protein n=1 Tax=Aerococcus urinaeequi TaxID=51665 RepID=UPI00352A93A1
MVETLKKQYTEKEVETAIKLMIQYGMNENQDTKKRTTFFGFDNKDEMQQGKGTVFHSEAELLEVAPRLSHFTCNPYIKGGYSLQNLGMVWGHAEKNLAQINMFYIDIDSHETAPENLIIACEDTVGFQPTIVLQTPKGYQLYFVLDNPAFVGKKRKVVDVAKRISQALREALAEQVPAIDFGCNHFGISRIPSVENLIYFNQEYLVNFEDFIYWSMKKDHASRGTKVFNQVTIKLGQLRQVDDPWFKRILAITDIKGGKGKSGRNTAIFTLALACYSSGIPYEECNSLLTDYNKRLKSPLTLEEFNSILTSAYSGTYKAASLEHIHRLCTDWISPTLSVKDLIKPRHWYKVAKSRDERSYSHIEEWENDLLNHFLQNGLPSKTIFEGKKSDLIELIGIPKTSLDRLLAKLVKSNKLVVLTRKGRGGGITILAGAKLIRDQILKKLKELANHSSFYKALQSKAYLEILEILDRKLNMAITQQTVLDSG